MRNYKRKTTSKYTEEDLQKDVEVVKRRKLSIKEASRKYGISFSTLQRTTAGVRGEKNGGGQNALSVEFEKYLLKSLDILTYWKVPFDAFDIRCLVKAYHDSANIQLPKFRNNLAYIRLTPSGF